MNKKNRTKVLADRIYSYFRMNHMKGKIQIGYNEIGRKLGEANLGLIHRALGSLIADGKIVVLQDNGGRGAANARVYGITAILNSFSVA